MAQFEQLQELWQRQPQTAVRPVEAANLTRLLRAYGHRRTWINAARTLAVSLVIGWLFARVGSSRPAIAGIALVAAAAALLLIEDWRSQRAIARRDFAAPSAGFVRETIERLMAQREFCRRRYWPVMGAMVLGANLMLAAALPLWVRAVGSCAPFVGFELGMWIRRKLWDHECRPLLEELRAVESALEARSE